jgi:hypothetical protein
MLFLQECRAYCLRRAEQQYASNAEAHVRASSGAEGS